LTQRKSRISMDTNKREVLVEVRITAGAESTFLRGGEYGSFKTLYKRGRGLWASYMHARQEVCKMFRPDPRRRGAGWNHGADHTIKLFNQRKSGYKARKESFR